MDYNTGKLKTGDSLFQVWFEQIILKLHVPTILANTERGEGDVNTHQVVMMIIILRIRMFQGNLTKITACYNMPGMLYRNCLLCLVTVFT